MKLSRLLGSFSLVAGCYALPDCTVSLIGISVQREVNMDHIETGNTALKSTCESVYMEIQTICAPECVRVCVCITLSVCM